MTYDLGNIKVLKWLSSYLLSVRFSYYMRGANSWDHSTIESTNMKLKRGKNGLHLLNTKPAL